MDLIKIVAESPEWVMYIDEDGDVITVLKKPKNSSITSIPRRLANATKSQILSAFSALERLPLTLKTNKKRKLIAGGRS